VHPESDLVLVFEAPPIGCVPALRAEADFIYEREGARGVSVFCDGPDHDQPGRQARDTSERATLEDLGYRVIVIRYDGNLEDQVQRNTDVFGPGVS
jgi:very-short-patch-repair endonuclease